MYLLRYTPWRRNLMLDRPQPQRIPLIFFRTAIGSEAVRGWLRGLKELEQ
jgi:hypothetical protein